MSQTHPSGSSDPKVIAGRYEVEKRLGAGAMGVVYKARDLTLRRDVAIKTIRFESLAASQTASDDLLARFKREATTAAHLKHPNIVTIYDIGDAGGLSYIAMEFIDGPGLERIIRDSGKMPVARAAGLTAQVADALFYAHQNGVIHRDIKPANIMVEPGERVKVTDFGIAKPMDSAEDLTATGSLLGTPSYMSPEQARAHRIDGRSDLFSAGCLLYEMLTGRKAFSGDSITAIIVKIIQEPPPPVRELNPLVPEQVVRVIDKALAKTPEERYQTGLEMARDLQALSQPGFMPTLHAVDVPTSKAPAGDAPTIATPPTAHGTVSSQPTAARGAPADSGATAPVPPTQVVPPPVPPASEPSPPAPRASRRPRPAPARRPAGGPRTRRGVLLAAGALVLLAAVAAGLWMVLGRGAGEPGPEVARSEGPPTAAPTTPASPETATTAPNPPPPPPTASPPAATAPGASTPAARETARATPPPAATAPPPRTEPPPPSTRTAPPPATTAPPPSSDDFLDEMPEETPDGRAAAQALAQQYSSGGSSSSGFGSASRFKKRPRIPRHTAAETPAVRALAWILSAQNSHFRRTGRYGSLRELVDSGDLPLAGEWTDDGFTRREYRFTVTASGRSFRADARPLSPRGRAFYTDDSGFVLVADD